MTSPNTAKSRNLGVKVIEVPATYVSPTENIEELEKAKKHSELLGVSHSNDAFHDLSAPDLSTWFTKEMSDIEKDIAELASHQPNQKEG